MLGSGSSSPPSHLSALIVCAGVTVHREDQLACLPCPFLALRMVKGGSRKVSRVVQVHQDQPLECRFCPFRFPIPAAHARLSCLTLASMVLPNGRVVPRPSGMLCPRLKASPRGSLRAVAYTPSACSNFQRPISVVG